MLVVAIDGPAGVGKSTIAKNIAEKASLFYVNSGNFYRAITLDVIKNKLSITDTDLIIDIAKKIKFSLVNERLHVNNVDIEDKLHSDSVDSLVAQVSSIVKVRRLVNNAIRKTTESMNIIVEGRDITTVVFPNADLKVYLDASVATRAARRHNQGVSNLSLKEIEETIITRDQIDKSKPEGSLKISDDALYLDTSDLTIDEVCDKVLQKLSKM
jgi:cytidylate kinase